MVPRQCRQLSCWTNGASKNRDACGKKSLFTLKMLLLMMVMDMMMTTTMMADGFVGDHCVVDLQQQQQRRRCSTSSTACNAAVGSLAFYVVMLFLVLRRYAYLHTEAGRDQRHSWR